MYPGDLRLLTRPFKEPEACHGDNRRSRYGPMRNLSEACCCEQNSGNGQQKRISDHALIQRLQAEKNRQPPRAESPYCGNNEGIDRKSEKASFKNQRERRTSL